MNKKIKMKIFIIESDASGYHDEGGVEGAFKSKQGAEKYIDEYKKKHDIYLNNPIIVEMELED